MEIKLFSSDHINTSRQSEIDWGRGLAVLFMVLIHVYSEVRDFMLPEAYSKVLNFAGGPLAAPVFMALLGVGIIYSKNRTPKKLAFRGVILFAAHYALNFLCFGVPSLIMLARTGDEYYRTTFWQYNFGVDILAFAGLTFLFFALTEKLKLKNVQILLIVLVISIINYIAAVPVDNQALGAVLGLFFRVNDFAFFPFFSWIWYPVMGYIFGSFLIRCTDKKVFYKYAFVFSALVIVLVSLGAHKYGFDIWTMHTGDKTNYFHQDFISHILVSAIFFLWLSVLYGLSRFKISRLPGKIVSRWSRNVTVIYFVHWLIIGWVSILAGARFGAGSLVFTVTGVAIFVLSDSAAWLYLKIKKAIKK
jgi:uncharacterized membrane protein